MQQEIVPTSPKYKGADKKTVKKEIVRAKLSLFEFILLAIFCLLGGYLSHLFFNNYLDRLSDLPQQIVYLQQQRAKEVSVNEALTKIEPSAVDIFKNDEMISAGIILTSDGWVAAALPAGTYSADELTVTTNDRENRKIKNLIYDEYSEIYFLYSTGENDLRPVQFADEEQLALGDTVMAVFNSLHSGQRVTVTNLENLSFNDENDYSVAKYPHDYLIADNLRKEYFSSALINNAGDVIGINLLDNRVLPHAYFSEIMPQVISQQKIERIDLDFEYSNLDKGAEIINIINNKQLLINDIILKIDDQEINKSHNLTALLQEYQPGDTAVFTIKRQEKEKEIEVEL